MSKKKISVIILIVFSLIAVLGFSYAYFSAQITGNETASATNIVTGNMKIIYTDGNEVTTNGASPGWSATKTFSITNNGNLPVYYDIVWTNVTNLFTRTDDFIYKVSGKYSTVTKSFPIENGSILSGIGIKPGETQNYSVTFQYLTSNENQIVDMNKMFTGKFEVVSSENNLWQYQNTSNQINQSGDFGSVSHKFILNNRTSSTAEYAIILNEVINTYSDKNNLTYTLKKGNTTIVSNQKFLEQDGSLQTISLSSKTDTEYELILNYSGNDSAGMVKGVIEFTSKENAFYAELRAVEALVNSLSAANSYIGTALTATTPTNIRGINYWQDWYLVTTSELATAGLNALYGPYIVRYTSGAVQSIPGEMINNVPVHTINYTGEGDNTLYLPGILSGTDADATKTTTKWGELTITGSAEYDAQDGLILGNDHGILEIDQTRPVNNLFSINFTVKGAYPQTNVETFPRTIVAISSISGAYLSWIGIRNNYLHVYSFYSGGARSLIDKEETVAGFTSINLSKADYGIGNINNQYLNIQVTAVRGGLTKVYINGNLIQTFNSGTAVLDYARMTVGDLRAGRGLKYEGAIYNFALYSEELNYEAITQNWNYTKWQLGIN